MTNKEIMDIAMQQSAYDTNAKVSDFLQDTNVFVKSGVGPLARKYYKEPIACNFVSYGSNVVASVKDEFKEIVETYLSKFEFYHCFETPNMHWLDERMKEKGYRVCFMAEYFLPDMERLKRLECNYVLKVLEQKDFADLYLPMWGNALCADRKELDVLGVGAYDGEKLVGLAACSADCDNMWQIGVDVLPEYRRMGIASSLTSNLAIEIIERGKVVFDGINFYETLTPAKVGKIAGAAYKQWDGHLFQDYLKRFQLPADKEIKSLSKGMKMKLCIAVALSHNPKLLILDEATSGLDPVMRDDILDVFLEFVQDENHSILMSSHITTDLEKVADYITFIHQGKVLFCKTKDELRYNYGIIRCGAALFDQLDKAEILAYRKDDYQWNVLVADKEKARRKYKNAVVDDATIDDILLLYVKGEQAK